MQNNKTHRLHPLVLVASVALTLVSLLGIAAITGVLPESRSKELGFQETLAQAPAQAQVRAPRAVHKAEPASKPANRQVPAICASCGTVESVNAVREAAPEGSGVGAVAGAVLGGVLGNQVGDGNGRKLATVAGAIGGGYAGNAIEKRTMATTHYVVNVRMDNGSSRNFTVANAQAWKSGDQVRVVDGGLRAIG